MSKEWLNSLSREIAEQQNIERVNKEWQIVAHRKIESGAVALWSSLAAEITADAAQLNREFQSQKKSVTITSTSTSLEIAADFFPNSIVRAKLAADSVEVELNEGALTGGLFRKEPPLDIRLAEDGEIRFKHGQQWLGLADASKYIIEKLFI